MKIPGQYKTFPASITISDEINNEIHNQAGHGINAFLFVNYVENFLQEEEVKAAIRRNFNLKNLKDWTIKVDLQGEILAGNNRCVVKTEITLCRAADVKQRIFALKLTSPFSFSRMKPADIANELKISRKFDRNVFFNQHYSKTFAVASYAIDAKYRRKIKETYSQRTKTVDYASDFYVTFQLDTWVDGIKALELIRRISKLRIPADKKRLVIKDVIKMIATTAFQGWRSLRLDGMGLIFDINPDDVIISTRPDENVLQTVKKGTVVFIDADGGRSMGQFSTLAEALDKSQRFVERLG